MALNYVSDIGAPLAVTAVNIATRNSTTTVLGQPLSDILVYIMAGGGYLAEAMGWGGRLIAPDFVKNVAIAAAPLAFDKIYTKLKNPIPRMAAMSRVSRYPAPANESPFQGVRLV